MSTIQDDYKLFLTEIGLTQEQVDESLRATVVSDVRCDKVHVTKSAIAGQGVFAVHLIESGEQVGALKRGRQCFELWRFTNHSPTPNAAVVKFREYLILVALRDIAIGDEITANYRQVKDEMESTD